MSESQNSPPPQLGTNSSSVAIAILVPFFALIFTGFGFYLYKQRYVCFLLKCSSVKCEQQKGVCPCHRVPLLFFVYDVREI